MNWKEFLKNNRKKIVIISIFMIIVILIIAGYPSFFILKPYAYSGGFVGLPQDKICKCIGIPYSYYPNGCADCFESYYCIGSLHDCKCFNETKAQEYREAFDSGEIEGNYWDSFEEYAYSECVT